MNRVSTEVRYQLAKRHLEHEERDMCGSEDLASVIDLNEIAMPHPMFSLTAPQRREGRSVHGGGIILKSVRGMGTIYDWRRSPWTPSNGGRIRPLVMVQHIPVVPNMAGIADFIRLRDVLVAQGLMVQNATDRDGNVALYTAMDSLCYQARGANQQSTGIEHMHATTGEAWSKKQLRAAAWLVNQGLEKCSIPTTMGTLGSGNGTVRVLKKGQTSHKRVSAAAGYNDRSDPGSGYDHEYVRHCVKFFRDKGHMEGA